MDFALILGKTDIEVIGNTQPGTNVKVAIGGTEITFAEVFAGGETTVATSSTGTAPPSGFKLGNPPTYYDISTTAGFTPPVEICINYNETQFNQEKNLKLQQFKGGQWVNITISLDVINNVVCGKTDTFSEFAIFEIIPFVLFAGEEIMIEKNVQILNGDLISNGRLKIGKNTVVNSNLFADKIVIDKNSLIKGDALFNELNVAKNSIILGVTSTPISLPIMEFSLTPIFETGDQDLVIKQNQTINPGRFDKIEVNEDVTLTLNRGTYNLNRLKLNKRSKLLFFGPVIINIQKEIEIKKEAIIFPSDQIITQNLIINIQGDKNIDIGENSSLNFLLFAPNSQVNLGERITFRGQVSAKEIKIGKNSIFSRVEDEKRFLTLSFLKSAFSNLFANFLKFFRATLLSSFRW